MMDLGFAQLSFLKVVISDVGGATIPNPMSFVLKCSTLGKGALDVVRVWRYAGRGFGLNRDGASAWNTVFYAEHVKMPA